MKTWAIVVAAVIIVAGMVGAVYLLGNQRTAAVSAGTAAKEACVTWQEDFRMVVWEVELASDISPGSGSSASIPEIRAVSEAADGYAALYPTRPDGCKQPPYPSG